MVESIYCFIMALLGLSTLILIIIKECTANEQKKLSLTAAIYVMLFITFAFVLLGQLVIILLAVIAKQYEKRRGMPVFPLVKKTAEVKNEKGVAVYTRP